MPPAPAPGPRRACTTAKRMPCHTFSRGEVVARAARRSRAGKDQCCCGCCRAPLPPCASAARSSCSAATAACSAATNASRSAASPGAKSPPAWAKKGSLRSARPDRPSAARAACSRPRLRHGHGGGGRGENCHHRAALPRIAGAATRHPCLCCCCQLDHLMGECTQQPRTVHAPAHAHAHART